MNRLEPMRRTLVAEADLHRSALRLEKRLISLRAQALKDDLRSNPIALLAGGIAAWKSRRPPGQAELWLRVAADAMQLIRDLRRS